MPYIYRIKFRILEVRGNEILSGGKLSGGTSQLRTLAGTLGIGRAPQMIVEWVRFPVGSHRRLEKRCLRPVPSRAQ